MILDQLSLQGSDFLEANLEGAVFLGTDLRGSDFSDTVIADTDFNEADLSGAGLSALWESPERNHPSPYPQEIGHFVGAKLIDAKIINVRFSGDEVDNADFSGAYLNGDDFSGATLKGTRLTGICYGPSTKWPKGFAPPPPSDPRTCLLDQSKILYGSRGETIPGYVLNYDQTATY